MRKHPLLAFVTAIVTCSIPGAISTAQADTNNANATISTAATTAAATDLKSRFLHLRVAKIESAQESRARRRREARREAEKRAEGRRAHHARVEAIAAAKARHRLQARVEASARADAGAKPAAAAKRAAGARVNSRPSAKRASSVIHHYVALGGAWFSLRSCESHDDYAENTHNGYYGAYQFSLASWNAVGRSGLPSNASPQVQDAAAQALLARQGWHAWPTCSWKIGVV